MGRRYELANNNRTISKCQWTIKRQMIYFKSQPNLVWGQNIYWEWENDPDDGEVRPLHSHAKCQMVLREYNVHGKRNKCSWLIVSHLLESKASVTWPSWKDWRKKKEKIFYHEIQYINCRGINERANLLQLAYFTLLHRLCISLYLCLIMIYSSM